MLQIEGVEECGEILQRVGGREPDAVVEGRCAVPAEVVHDRPSACCAHRLELGREDAVVHAGAVGEDNRRAVAAGVGVSDDRSGAVERVGEVSHVPNLSRRNERGGASRRGTRSPPVVERARTRSSPDVEMRD